MLVLSRQQRYTIHGSACCCHGAETLSRQRWRQQHKENKQQRAGSGENVFPVRMKLCLCLMKEADRVRESGGQYSDWIILVSKWLSLYGTSTLIKVNKPYRYESLRMSLNWSSGVWRGGKTSKRLHFRWLDTLMDISTFPWTLLRVEESKIKVLEHKIKCIIRLFSSLLILGGDYIIILLLWASKSYLNDVVWEV